MAQAPDKNLSHEAFEAISQRFRVLSDPMRLKILYNLKTGEMSVTDIVETTGGSQSNVSKHLSLLRNAGIVIDEKRGKQVFYSLRVTCLTDFLVCVESVLESRVQQTIEVMR